jgi:hypothetical protein
MLKSTLTTRYALYVHGKHSVQIPSELPTTELQVLRGFYQSFQENAGLKTDHAVFFHILPIHFSHSSV